MSDVKNDDAVKNDDENQNAIEQITKEEAEVKNAMPSANLSARDGGNSKNFKMMAMVVIGLLIMLIGIAMTIGRYQQSKASEKAEEAERQAKEQKNLATGSKLDIDAEKQAMYEIPPPTDAQVEVETPPQTEPPIEPIVPVDTPPTQYNSYGNNDMVAGRDYVPPPAPVVEQPVEPQPQPEYKEPVIEPSSVLVDIYGSASASASTKETGLAKTFKSSQLADGSVDKRTDVSMLLMRGTTIPCVLQTKIDSTYQGFATCHLTKDVYSANGKVLLMERGSTVFGEQNVQITQGKARVSILWSKVETPNGISVSLDSPATGQLGEMGIGAKVNNHFWQRFGGAILLSVIKDVSAVGRSHLEKQDKNGETTNINNTTGTAEKMSEEVLKNTINIPPTATVNQGTVINIMVARDVDFSSVYKVVRY